MTNLEKYEKAFISTFGVDASQLSHLKYQDVESWDSVGHMGLISTIEDTFGIMMDADDIIDLSSFEKGIEILKKYGIEI